MSRSNARALLSTEPTLNEGSDVAKHSKTYRNERVYLADLASRPEPMGSQARLSGYTFIDCDVRGPAVLNLGPDAPCTFDSVGFIAPGMPKSSFLIEAGEDGAVKQGLILAEACAFERGTISGIAFAIANGTTNEHLFRMFGQRA